MLFLRQEKSLRDHESASPLIEITVRRAPPGARSGIRTALAAAAVLDGCLCRPYRIWGRRYLYRGFSSRHTFVAVGISPKLSTARRIASIHRVHAAHAGGMTQNLSAGVSGPHAAPGGGTTGGVQSSPPAAETPASHETQIDREAPVGIPRPSRPSQPQGGGPQPAGTPQSATPRAGRHRAKKLPKYRRKPSPARSADGRRAAGQGREAGVALDARTMAERQVRIGSPAALLAVVPALLGFEPGNSLVVIGTEPPGAHVRLTLRYDLPDPGLAAAVARHATNVLSAQRIRTAVAVGY